MILTIRQKNDSGDLIKDLKKTGYQIHFEKFSNYKVINFNLDFNSRHFFLISSMQTIRSLQKKPTLLNQLAKKGKLFVIGDKVEKELKKLKFKLIIRTFIDSKELISYIKQKYKSKIYINHLTGSIENKNLNLFAKQNYVILNFIETYSAKFKKSISDKLKFLIQRKKIYFMFHYSLKASEVFYDILDNDEQLFFKNNLTHFCLSNRIRKGLLALDVRADAVYSSKKVDHVSLMSLFTKKIVNLNI